MIFDTAIAQDSGEKEECDDDYTKTEVKSEAVESTEDERAELDDSWGKLLEKLHACQNRCWTDEMEQSCYEIDGCDIYLMYTYDQCTQPCYEAFDRGEIEWLEEWDELNSEVNQELESKLCPDDVPSKTLVSNELEDLLNKGEIEPPSELSPDFNDPEIIGLLAKFEVPEVEEFEESLIGKEDFEKIDLEEIDLEDFDKEDFEGLKDAVRNYISPENQEIINQFVIVPEILGARAVTCEEWISKGASGKDLEAVGCGGGSIINNPEDFQNHLQRLFNIQSGGGKLDAEDTQTLVEIYNKHKENPEKYPINVNMEADTSIRNYVGEYEGEVSYGSKTPEQFGGDINEMQSLRNDFEGFEQKVRYGEVFERDLEEIRSNIATIENTDLKGTDFETKRNYWLNKRGYRSLLKEAENKIIREDTKVKGQMYKVEIRDVPRPENSPVLMAIGNRIIEGEGITV